jgi:hypothetical protein
VLPATDLSWCCSSAFLYVVPPAAMLFYAHTLIAAERFSAHLWTELDIHLGPTGVFERTWALGVLPNAFHWLHGMRLPVAAVCLNALVAHLEPVTLSWCSQWTVCARQRRRHAARVA